MFERVNKDRDRVAANHTKKENPQSRGGRRRLPRLNIIDPRIISLVNMAPVEQISQMAQQLAITPTRIPTLPQTPLVIVHERPTPLKIAPSVPIINPVVMTRVNRLTGKPVE